MKQKIGKYETDEAKNQRLIREKTQEDAIKEQSNTFVPEPTVYDENSSLVNNTTTVPNTVVPPPEPVYDENTPYVQPQQPVQQPVAQPEVQQPSEADILLQKLYSQNIPEPVIDQAKIDRLQRMGKINGIAQMANLFGDAISLGIGGNVRRRQPDRVAPMIYQQYESIMDRNKAEKDAWNVRDFQSTRNNLIHGISEEHRKEAERLANARLKASTELQKQKADQDWTKFVSELSRKDRDALERNRHNKSMEGSSWLRAEKTGAKDKDTKPFTTINVDGKDIPLTEGEHRAALQEALDSKAFSKGDIKAIMATYGNAPLEGEKNIIQRYKAWKAQKDKEAASQVPISELGITGQPQPSNVIPASQNTTQPTATPDITEEEYAKLKKGDKFFFGGKQLIKQ